MSLCYEGSNTDWWRWVPFFSKRRNVKEITKSTRLEKKKWTGFRVSSESSGSYYIPHACCTLLRYCGYLRRWGKNLWSWKLYFGYHASSLFKLSCGVHSVGVNYLFFFLFFPYFLFLFIVYRILPRLLLSYRCKI